MAFVGGLLALSSSAPAILVAVAIAAGALLVWRALTLSLELDPELIRVKNIFRSYEFDWGAVERVESTLTTTPLSRAQGFGVVTFLVRTKGGRTSKIPALSTTGLSVAKLEVLQRVLLQVGEAHATPVLVTDDGFPSLAESVQRRGQASS